MSTNHHIYELLYYFILFILYYIIIHFILFTLHSLLTRFARWYLSIVSFRILSYIIAKIILKMATECKEMMEVEDGAEENVEFNCACLCGESINTLMTTRSHWIYCDICQLPVFVWCIKASKCQQCDDSPQPLVQRETIQCLCDQTPCPAITREGGNRCRRCFQCIAETCGFFHDGDNSSICCACIVYFPKFISLGG